MGSSRNMAQDPEGQMRTICTQQPPCPTLQRLSGQLFRVRDFDILLEDTRADAVQIACGKNKCLVSAGMQPSSLGTSFQEHTT